MLYAQVKKGLGSPIVKFPLQTQDVRRILDEANISHPRSDAALEAQDLTHLNLFTVPHANAPKPTKPLRRAILGKPVWRNDGLVRTFTEVAYTNAETAKAWAALRARRDALLAATDWSQHVSDIDDDRRDLFRAYRRRLRDLPAGVKDPFAPAWPARPV